MVRTERISTHDRGRGTIPFKDQILAANHHFMLRFAEWALGNSQFEIPGLGDNSVVIAAENLTPIALENVMRAYMAETDTSTSLYVHYMRGEHVFAGHRLPDGLIANGRLPYIMDTPSTKSDRDETISPDEVVARGICTRDGYIHLRNNALAAFGAVSGFLLSRGIILADTKTEHGRNSRGEIVGKDEYYTMDSSRYWLLADYREQERRLRTGELARLKPKSFSKEFARGMVEGDKGFTDEQRLEIAVRYIEGIQHLLGQRFEPDLRPRDERVVTGLQAVVEHLLAA